MKKYFSLILISCFCSCALVAQQWTPVGPAGAFIREVVIHPNNPSTWFAGADDSGGLWKSTDGGTSWRLVTESMPNFSAWHIELHPSNPDVMWACDVYGRYPVIHSTDAGETWQLKEDGLVGIPSRQVTKLALLNNDTLFISTGLDSAANARSGNGIFRSIDGGNTWNQTGLQGKSVPCIATTPLDQVLAGTFGFGLQFSANGGNTWFVHNDLPSNAIVHQVEVKDSVVAVATAADVFLSTDAGQTFQSIGFGAYDISIARTDPEPEVYSSFLQKYTPSSGWTPIVDTLLPDSLLMLGVSAFGDTIFFNYLANSPEMVYSTSGGSSWSHTPTTPAASYVADLAINPNDGDHLVVAMIGSNNIGRDIECLMESGNGGLSWSRTGPESSATRIIIDYGDSDTWYLGTFQDGLFKTSDGGDSWNNVRPGLRQVVDLLQADNNVDLLLLSEITYSDPTTPVSEGLFRSTNGGATFDTVFPAHAIQLLQLPQSDRLLMATAFNGIYESTNAGLSWQGPFALNGLKVTALYFYNEHIYAGAEFGQLIQLDLDGDITNTFVSPWEPNAEITNILFKEGRLFVGTNGAENDQNVVSNHGEIWFTDNLGVTWQNVQANLANTQFFGTNSFQVSANKLWVSTYGGGVFRLDNEPTTGISSNHQNIQLFQVFPNPTSGLLNIDFGNVAKTGSFTLSTINGQVLQHGEFEETLHQEIDVTLFARGVYLLQVTTATQSNHHQIIRQ